MPTFVRRAATLVAALAAAWLVIGTALVLTPAPRFGAAAPRLPFTARPAGCRPTAELRCFRTREGGTLAVRITPSGGPGVIVMLHGVHASGAQLADAAKRLREATGATVLCPDLRGHGRSSGLPGDVDHIGQYEEDVADLVAALRREHPQVPLLLAGHSMGGGIALRYAARADVPPVDGYLLFAPHLGATSPTSRTPRAAAGADEAPVRLHLPRTIGLVMLNAAGIRGLNGLGTLFFNQPDGTPLRAYTYRAMAGMAPEDHRRALGADRRPLLVIVGARDEAFTAAAYPAVVALHPGGRTVIVPDATHDGLLSSPETYRAVRAWSASPLARAGSRSELQTE
jgi:pimeloyl-ACP methyl ester carboxylesterase